MRKRVYFRGEKFEKREKKEKEIKKREEFKKKESSAGIKYNNLYRFQ